MIRKYILKVAVSIIGLMVSLNLSAQWSSLGKGAKCTYRKLYIRIMVI